MRFFYSIFFAISLLLAGITSGYAGSPLNINPGPPQPMCEGGSTTLGGSPTAAGGTAPYTYSWWPATGLSSATASNPSVTITSSTWYHLKVTDSTGTIKTDSVYVYYNFIVFASAGKDTAFCLGGSAVIGKNNPSVAGLTYTWTPTAGLNNPSSPNPVGSPTITTNYTVTINQSPCSPKTATVLVTVHQVPKLDAGAYVIINEGDKATLHASGAKIYLWTPSNTITYNGTANPDAQPSSTTLYTVTATDKYGCNATDTVTVIVRRDDDIVLYNTFSPNGDGSNDLFYIGNIQKYPLCKLDVFNRFGKLVYTRIGYANDWDGTNFGDKLPEATYYYVLDLGNGSKPYRGSVTIIR